MTLVDAILKKAKSPDSVRKKYNSPPPEIEESVPKKKKHVEKYAHVKARVDLTVPAYPISLHRAFLASCNRFLELYKENLRLVFAIKRALILGRADDRWVTLPPSSNQYYEARVNFLKKTIIENQQIYKRILSTRPRVAPTEYLRRDWLRNRSEIIRKSEAKFVLFSPVITEEIEDEAFLAPPGVKRPRVHLTLRVRGCAVLGVLVAEMFTDVCPRTCGLFLELLDGDGLGHGYVGTRFFRKVPGLFWSGGDVIYDNGFGCYAQRGRIRPIGAENYHFSHSMPGLLSMRVTKDDEMCGIFNVTFKRLPQFDLKNEVFGRIIPLGSTYDSIRTLGSALSNYPVVELTAAKRKNGSHWIHGTHNTRIQKLSHSSS